MTVGDALADGRPGVAAEAIVPSTWGRGTDVLPSEPAVEHRVAEATPGSEQRLRTVLAGIGHRYELVVMDCPPSLGEMTREALASSDLALVVTTPSYFGAQGGERAMAEIDEVRKNHNRDLQLAGIVVNRVRSVAEEHQYREHELVEIYGRSSVMKPLVPERIAVQQAEGYGQPVQLVKTAGGREVADIYETY